MRPIIFLLLVFCFIANCKSADVEYDYDEEPAPAPITPAPAKPASRLGSLLSARGRAPVGGRKPSAPTSTTSKPVESVIDEEAIDDVLDDENVELEEPLTTTTEASKKLRTAGGVRPFRSNEDLLATLKRRRSQVGKDIKEHTTHTPLEPTTSKSKPSSSVRSKIGPITNESKPATRGRFGGNSRSKLQEEVEETQQEEVQVKAKPFRRG